MSGGLRKRRHYAGGAWASEKEENATTLRRYGAQRPRRQYSPYRRRLETLAKRPAAGHAVVKDCCCVLCVVCPFPSLLVEFVVVFVRRLLLAEDAVEPQVVPVREGHSLHLGVEVRDDRHGLVELHHYLDLRGGRERGGREGKTQTPDEDERNRGGGQRRQEAKMQGTAEERAEHRDATRGTPTADVF